MDRSRHAPYLITGRHGQLGSAWCTLLSSSGSTPVPHRAVGREDLDFSAVREAFFAQLDALWVATPFKTILNGAAYTAVDRAETEVALATRVNAEAVGWMGEWAQAHDVHVVHFSTDYVFSGEGTAPWKETDQTDPINAYGKSKLEGERRLLAAHPHGAWIFRTSWVYDATGKNFFRTIRRLAAERPNLKIVDDQWGAPSYAPMLAAGVLNFLSHTEDFSNAAGVTHFSGSGETTWAGFAREIIQLSPSGSGSKTNTVIESIPSSAYPTPAARPKNSRLDLTRLAKQFGYTPPPWREDLERCIQTLEHQP